MRLSHRCVGYGSQRGLGLQLQAVWNFWQENYTLNVHYTCSGTWKQQVFPPDCSDSTGNRARPASTLLLTLQSYHPQVSDPQHGQPLNMTCGKKRISQNNFKKQKQIGRLLFKSQAPIIRILKDGIFFLKVSLLFSIQKIMTHLF